MHFKWSIHFFYFLHKKLIIYGYFLINLAILSLIMKKIILICLSFLIISSSLCLLACEGATFLECASISEVTMAGSKDYTIKINFYQDERIEDKYIDIQVKSNKIADLVMWEDNGEKTNISFDDYDEWRSLSTLLAASKGEEVIFDKFKNIAAKTYVFNSDEKLNLTFRVVAGEVEENGSGNGQILVGSEVISRQFTLKIK